jgi:hypothetical protein
MPVVKYRLHDPRLAPRRTRTSVPGWAGEPEPRANGSHEQPWHCIPFTEAAVAGIELFYPYEEELHVTTQDGELVLSSPGQADAPTATVATPFRSFGKWYYTYQSLIDFKVGEGQAIKVETHPRFYTDRTGTVPIAVPALIRHWWPMIYFVVFKAPLPGQTHIFRPGEPFIQFSVVQADDKIDLIEMPAEEAAERDLQSERIYASRSILSSDTQWTSSTDTVFDGTYRRIYGAAKSSKT